MARIQSAQRNQYKGIDQEEMANFHRKRERLEQDSEIEIQEGIVVAKKKRSECKEQSTSEIAVEETSLN